MGICRSFVVCLSLLAVGCAYAPMGPTVRAMPAQGKPFEQFRAEQDYCKQYASEQTGGQAERANSTAILEGVGGAVLGAGLGAAVGGGEGAAIGAAGGALAGTLVGSGSSSGEQRGIQGQYDDAYVQCMAAKGNQIERPMIYAPPQTTVIYKQTPTVVYETVPTVIYEPVPMVVYPRHPHPWRRFR